MCIRDRNTCDTAAILKGENLVQFTKSRRIRWLRCVKITDRERQQKRILYGKIRGVRQWAVSYTHLDVYKRQVI